MSSSIFSRARDVLGEVVLLSGAERDERLGQLCDGDDVLRDEVLSLLACDEQPDERLTAAEGVRGLIDGLLAEATRGGAGHGSPMHDVVRSEEGDPPTDGTVHEVDGTLGPGARIGGFSLGDRLGAGGMGVVFEAYQDEPRRTVALKIVAGGQASPEVLARFRQEVHVLGRLDHPRIAALYEAGAVRADGIVRPFYVMQRVAGEPLTRWVRATKPGVRTVVGVLADIADAVAHAHAHGVIHRDLKPGNLLVDGDGNPTVLDFGIARLTDANTQLTSLHTESGSLLGTLPYMSPEQASGDVEGLDARTDVYALGVVLFEALTGQLPLEVDGLSVPAAALLIQQRDPARLTDHDASQSADLDVLVDKCLAKERSRRYDTAGELAADLRRWLLGHTLIARPLGRGELLVRWVRRHRGVSVGLAVAFTSLLVALVISLDQTGVATRARDEALREADRSKVIAAAAALDSAEPMAALEQLLAVSEAGRGWEWRYHRQRLSSELSRWEADPDTVASALAATDRVLELRRDGALFAYELPGRALVDERRLDVAGPVAGAAFDRLAGRVLVVVDGPQAAALQLFDASSGDLVFESGVATLKIPMALSGDGRSLAWWGAGGLVSWTDRDDIAPGDRLVERTLARRRGLGAEGASAVSMVMHADRILVMGGFGQASLFDARDLSREPIRQRISQQRPTAFAISPHGETAAVALRDGSIVLVDTSDGQLTGTLRGHRGHVRGLAFHADGQVLFTHGVDRTLRRWNVSDAAPLDVRPTELTAVSGLSVIDSHALLRGPGKQFALFDLEHSPRADVLDEHTGYVYDVDVLEDGRVLSGSWDKTLRAWDPSTGEALGVWAQDERVSLVMAAPTGSRVMLQLGGRMELLESPSSETREVLDPSWSSLRSATWFPDGERILATCREKTSGNPSERRFRALSVRTGEVEFEIPSDEHDWRHVAMSSDGRRVVTARRKGELAVWTLAPTRKVGALPVVDGAISAMALTPDGGRLFVGTNDGLARLDDVDRLVIDHQLSDHPDKIWDAAFTPDGTRLATACHDGIIRLFDVTTGELVAQLRGHSDYVKGIAFTRDGDTLVSGSGDETVRLWHTTTVAERLARGAALRDR